MCITIDLLRRIADGIHEKASRLGMSGIDYCNKRIGEIRCVEKNEEKANFMEKVLDMMEFDAFMEHGGDQYIDSNNFY